MTTLDVRKKLLARKKLCFNCTGSRHRAAECTSSSTIIFKLQNCKQKHHTSICNKRNWYLTTSKSNEGVLVYPVVSVEVETVKCRALLDTGTGNSYASAASLNRLPKRKSSKEVRDNGAVTKKLKFRR